jgi:hypothetical protein
MDEPWIACLPCADHGVGAEGRGQGRGKGCGTVGR